MTVSHWINGNRRPRLRNIFREEPSPSLSYIIGANLGDGCSLLKSGCVKLEVTDLDFAEAFNSRMAKLFSRQVPNKILVRRFHQDRLPLLVVKYNSKQLTNVLRLSLKALLDLAFAFPREFLRGFFDAEGHVDVAARGSFNLFAGAENSNRKLLLSIKSQLWVIFRIRARIQRKRKSGTVKVIRGKSFRMRRNSFSLVIQRLRDLQGFEKRIGFSILRKRRKLADALAIVANYPLKERSGVWRRLYLKLNGEWVRRQLPVPP
jgi:intein-encoded DNA endonuclease-like protein